MRQRNKRTPGNMVSLPRDAILMLTLPSHSATCTISALKPCAFVAKVKGWQTAGGGGVQMRRFPNLGLSILFYPLLSFPNFLGIFPIGPSRLSRPVELKAPTRNIPERVRGTIRPFPEKLGNPPVWKLSKSCFFGKRMRTATFQSSESGSSLNGPDLFIELPFL